MIKIKISEIVKCDLIYPRIEISHKAIDDYAEVLACGEEFERIIVQRVINNKEEEIILLDGYHRTEAYKKNGIKEIEVEYWKDEIIDLYENLTDLRIESIKRNLKHGVRLKKKDKKKMCRIMAIDDIDIKTTEKEFADIFGVVQSTIHNWITDIRTKQKGSRDNLIYQLSALGWIQQDIGDKVGLSKSGVGDILKDAEIIIFDKIGQDYKNGKTPSELAEYYGLDIPMIWNILLQGMDDIERFKRFGKKDYGNKQPKMSDYWKFNKGIEYIGVEYPGMLWGQDIMNILYRFSNQGDLIIDPMAGGGSVVDICLIMGRRCLAFDINSIRDDIIELDIRDGFPENIKKADLIVLDPPYYKKKEDAYNCEEITKDRKTFLEFINKLSKDCRVILKDDGYIALVFGQYIDYEKEEDSILGIDYGRVFEDNGFRLILEIQSPLTFNNQYEPYTIENAKKYVPWRVLPVSRSWYIFKKLGSVKNVGL